MKYKEVMSMILPDRNTGDRKVVVAGKAALLIHLRTEHHHHYHGKLNLEAARHISYRINKTENPSKDALGKTDKRLD